MGEKGEVTLITIDPGHFHAGLVQKFSQYQINDTVYVYAPDGEDLNQHLQRVESYNSRSENPTSWQEVVYRGTDYQEKAFASPKGNVVVLSGNNALKASYIGESVANGLNVLADKPMIIESSEFEALKNTFAQAREKGILVYDIMTERFEITTLLQKELSQIETVFGSLEKGSLGEPAVVKESVHHFFKYVSGKPLIRPAWFYNTHKQGEGLADVNTHLVDLVMWECFPEVAIDYSKDIELLNARRWPTTMDESMFSKTTGLDAFTEELLPFVEDSLLNVYSNGEINFTLKGIHAKTKVTWAFEAPEGGGDTHYSIMRGTLSDIEIIQSAEVDYVPTLFVRPKENSEYFEKALEAALVELSTDYPGLTITKEESGYSVDIPPSLRKGHEAHFGQVTERYLQYLKEGELPEWEVPNMLAKYFVTTSALDLARQ